MLRVDEVFFILIVMPLITESKKDLTNIGNLLVIGNGFDLDLDLETSYSDFFLSQIFENSSDKYFKLGNFLKTEAKVDKGWQGIEHSLAKLSYSKDNNRVKDLWSKYEFTTSSDFKKEYEALRDKLADYIEEATNQFENARSKVENKVAFKLMAAQDFFCKSDLGISTN